MCSCERRREGGGTGRGTVGRQVRTASQSETDGTVELIGLYDMSTGVCVCECVN